MGVVKDSVVFYRSFYDSVSSLTEKDLQLELYNAIFEYSLYGREIELSPLAKSMFILMKSNLDSNIARYNASVTNGKKGGEYGFLGGRPRKEIEEISEEEKPLETPKKPLKVLTAKPLNVNDNDNVNDNENDNENDNDDIIAPSNLKPFIELPLIKGEYHLIFQKDLDKYHEIYPAVDIKQAFRNMYGWLDSHPTNRKTKNGIARFINSWLSREQNKARVTAVDVVDVDVKELSDDVDDDELAKIINGEV